MQKLYKAFEMRKQFTAHQNEMYRVSQKKRSLSHNQKLFNPKKTLDLDKIITFQESFYGTKERFLGAPDVFDWQCQIMKCHF